MSRSFRQGALVGLLAPLAFLAAFALWIYRFTGRVPFPLRRTAEDELTLGLVEPGEVSSYWHDWRDELEPLVERIRSTISALTSGPQAQ